MIFSKTNRRGITLIEVLSAMAVASIGVFGVLVLVPLASRMSQVGFSNEAARSNSSNVLAKAKSFGALDYSRWVLSNTPTDSAPYLAVRPNGPACLDPWLLSQPAGAGIRTFPLRATGGVGWGMQRLSIARTRSTTPVRIGFATSLEMTSEANSIRMREAVNDAAQPTQKFLDDPTAGRITREITASKSSILLMLPTISIDSLLYRAMALTIDGRQVIGTRAVDRTFDVADFFGSAVIRSDYGSMDLVLSETGFDPGATESAENLPSGGWLILVPVDSSGIGRYEYAQGYEILSADQTTADGHTIAVNLVGPPYVVPSEVNPATGAITDMITKAIYVPGTVDIHEMEVRLGVE